MNNEGAAMEMPRYISHKKVWALKIKEIKQSIIEPSPFEGGSYTITPADERYAPFDVPRDYVERHFAEDGGYYVVYDDGYKSYSPAKAFEEGYTLIGGKRPSIKELEAILNSEEERPITILPDGSITA